MKVHRIWWGCNGRHQWSWRTICGEFFWPWWYGTTEDDRVTCQRCRKTMKDKIYVGTVDSKWRWGEYLKERTAKPYGRKKPALLESKGN